MPEITSRYDGTCRICGEKYSRGERIFYGGKKQTYHASCYRNPGTVNPAENVAPGYVPDAYIDSTPTVDKMVIDWHQLKNFVLDGFEGKASLNKSNSDQLMRVLNTRTDFSGHTRDDAIRWLKTGYETDALADVEDFAPRIREKSQFIYDEEGDEIDLSAAWSGEDEFMQRWEETPIVPGVTLEFEIQFSSFTRAEVVNAYQLWIAQAVNAITDAGIDPEINVVLTAGNTWDGKKHRQLIRVKTPGETTDMFDWSAMLSPAGYRSYGFAAKILHADRLKKNISSSIGQVNANSDWTVKFDSDEQAIVVRTPTTPQEFPADKMTSMLRESIEALKKNVSN